MIFSDGVIKSLLSLLRSKLTKETWKKHPSAKHALIWALKHLKVRNSAMCTIIIMWLTYCTVRSVRFPYMIVVLSSLPPSLSIFLPLVLPLPPPPPPPSPSLQHPHVSPHLSSFLPPLLMLLDDHEVKTNFNEIPIIHVRKTVRCMHV